MSISDALLAVVVLAGNPEVDVVTVGSGSGVVDVEGEGVDGVGRTVELCGGGSAVDVLSEGEDEG